MDSHFGSVPKLPTFQPYLFIYLSTNIVMLGQSLGQKGEQSKLAICPAAGNSKLETHDLTVSLLGCSGSCQRQFPSL